MRFIQEDDYKTVVGAEVINLLNNHNARWLQAEHIAIAQIKNHLAGLYDVEGIFEAQGDKRDAYMVMIVLDIAIYHLYTSVAPNNIPEYRAQRYEDALTWLNKAGKSQVGTTLPKKKLSTSSEDDDISNSSIQFKSKFKPENHRF